MKYYLDENQRKSTRLRGYDYTQAGAYFITICTHTRECLLGEVVNGEMRPNEYGNIANARWNEIPVHFSDVGTDSFVVMPNHIHGIIVLSDDCRGGVTPPNWVTTLDKTGTETVPLRKRTLGQIVAYFKYQTTKSINQIRSTPGVHVWQRNYYEHVIRNRTDLEEIREYIVNNPLKWDLDRENPNNVGARS